MLGPTRSEANAAGLDNNGPLDGGKAERGKKHELNLPTRSAGDGPATNPSHVCGDRKPISELSEAVLSDFSNGRGVLIGRNPSRVGRVFAVFDGRYRPVAWAPKL